jgi:hypothetical protein
MTVIPNGIGIYSCITKLNEYVPYSISYIIHIISYYKHLWYPENRETF